MQKPVVFYTEVAREFLQVGRRAVLCGVYGDPQRRSGSDAITAPVVRIDGDEIETANTIYRKRNA